MHLVGWTIRIIAMHGTMKVTFIEMGVIGRIAGQRGKPTHNLCCHTTDFVESVVKILRNIIKIDDHESSKSRTPNFMTLEPLLYILSTY